MSVVVVAVDGSESGDRAVIRAAEIARERNAEVVVVHVVPTTFVRERLSAQLDPASFDDEEAFAQAVIDRALTLLAERGVRAQGKILSGAPVHAILEELREVRPDVVVVGRRKPQTLPEGSVSKRVTAGAPDGVEVVVVE